MKTYTPNELLSLAGDEELSPDDLIADGVFSARISTATGHKLRVRVNGAIPEFSPVGAMQLMLSKANERHVQGTLRLSETNADAGQQRSALTGARAARLYSAQFAEGETLFIRAATANGLISGEAKTAK